MYFIFTKKKNNAIFRKTIDTIAEGTVYGTGKQTKCWIRGHGSFRLFTNTDKGWGGTGWRPGLRAWVREKEGMWGVGWGSTDNLGRYLAFGDTNLSSLYTSDLTNRTLPINVPLEHKIKLKPASKLKTSWMSLLTIKCVFIPIKFIKLIVCTDLHTHYLTSIIKDTYLIKLSTVYTELGTKNEIIYKHYHLINYKTPPESL